MARIVVAICTARRPEGLRRLLLSLRDVEDPAPTAVVVVDNDARRDGLTVCNAFRGDLPWPLTSVSEPRPGISKARNRAVRAALDHEPEFIAMLDDDEWPTPGWLRALMRIQRETGADVVGGPVVPVPVEPVDHWDVLAVHYGLLRDLPDGAPCTLYGAGNFLARRRCFEAVEGPFDPAFDRIGGEDMHFLERLRRLGHSMRWAAEAIVYEETPRERLSEDWLLMRQRRRGYIAVSVQRRLDPSPLAESSRMARSLAVLACAAIRRRREGLGARSDALLAEMYWNYALGRMRAHRRGEVRFAGLSYGGTASGG
jgi:succinoglycan biosynthesis protein ExoM